MWFISYIYVHNSGFTVPCATTLWCDFGSCPCTYLSAKFTSVRRRLPSSTAKPPSRISNDRKLTIKRHLSFFRFAILRPTINQTSATLTMNFFRKSFFFFLSFVHLAIAHRFNDIKIKAEYFRGHLIEYYAYILFEREYRFLLTFPQ